MDDETLKKLKQINIEDNIWVIYLFIIFFSFYSNKLEREYYIFKDPVKKEKYKKILIGIFTVLLIVYIYFLNSSYDDLKDLKPSDSDNKKMLVSFSFLASLLITISGIIFLYIAIVDNQLDVELAFN